MENYSTAGVRGQDAVGIDIARLASSLERTISTDNVYKPPQSCIFETPAILSRHNERAYVPNAFSIWPTHHANPKLQPTDKIKHSYLQGLLARVRDKNVSLCDLIKDVEEIEPMARECYATPLVDKYSKEQFVKMLVLDGCFLIELFRKNVGAVPYYTGDPIFDMPCMTQYLSHDLVLLENQIPWFVLQLLFDKTKEGSDRSLVILAILFFPSSIPSNPYRGVLS